MYQITLNGELFCDSRVEDLAVIAPVISLEANKAGTFKFTVPPTHPYHDKIVRRKSFIDVYRDEEEEPLFSGICTSIDSDFFKQETISCEGDLTFLNDSLQRPAKWQGVTVRQLLEAYITRHNNSVEEEKRFEVGVVTVADPNDYIYCFTNYQSTMTEIKEDLTDDYGGYLRTRHVDGVRYLDYLAESPNTNSQAIKLGENLVDFQSNLSSTDIATVIIPQGAKLETSAIEGLDTRLGIAEINDGKDYVVSEEAAANLGYIEQVVTWDEVTVASNLKSKAEKYLAAEQFDAVTITCNAIDLHLDNSEIEPFKLLDKVRVISKPHGLDKDFVLTKMTYNLNNPERDTITFGGETNVSLTARSANSNSDVLAKIEEIQPGSILEQAKKNATELLKTATSGYIHYNYAEDGTPTEMLIMDTPSVETSQKIWRWNVNGLGYSNDGGKTYGLAITMDGSIVADYITAGILQGILIKGNTIQGGSINGASINGGSVTVNTGSKYSPIIKIYEDIDKGAIINQTTMRAAWNGYYSQIDSGYVEAGTYTGQALGDKTTWAPKISMNFEGNFLAYGTKSRVVETEHYDDKLLYCMETPSPMFEDIGEGKIDETGKCYVFIDEVFSETIDTECSYQVFLQPYGKGECYVTERTISHFVVEGTPGLGFSWEIKAIQLKYDSIRLETYDPNDRGENESVKVINEVESYLDDLLYDIESEVA